MTQAPTTNGPNKTRIPCTDGFRRQRSIGVWTAPTNEQLVLVAPPAETALLTPDQARQLGTRLVELAAITEEQHAELVRAQEDVNPAEVV